MRSGQQPCDNTLSFPPAHPGSLLPVQGPVHTGTLSLQELPATTADPDIRMLWTTVEAQCPAASPFVRWPWVSAWLSVYGPALRPALLIGRVGHTPVGVALVHGHRILRRGLFPVRQLYLNTTDSGDGGAVYVEYNQLLCPRPYQAAFCRAILDHLARTRAWDELVLDGFVPTQTLDGASLGVYRERRRQPCFIMDLGLLRQRGQAPEAVLSANTRQQIRRSLRLFGGRGRVSLEEARSVAEAQSFLGELIALHQASWIERGQRGAFAGDHLEAFLRAFVDAGFPGSVQLLRLRDGAGRVLGVSCNVVDPTTAYYYQSGLLRQDDARCKPGLCLHLLAMEHSLRLGRECYDFMASELRYKQSLSNAQRELVWGAIERPRLGLLLEKLAVMAVRKVRVLRAR